MSGSCKIPALAIKAITLLAAKPKPQKLLFPSAFLSFALSSSLLSTFYWGNSLSFSEKPEDSSLALLSPVVVVHYTETC